MGIISRYIPVVPNAYNLCIVTYVGTGSLAAAYALSVLGSVSSNPPQSFFNTLTLLP